MRFAICLFVWSLLGEWCAGVEDRPRELEIDGTRYRVHWSPDGSHALYEVRQGGNRDVFLCDRDGQNSRNLTDHEADDFDAAWSADGEKIAFTSNRTGKFQIFMMGRDGKSLQQVSECEQGARSPKFGPRGSLGFLEEYPRQGKIRPNRLVLYDDMDFKPVTEISWVTDFAWSPDGKTIAIGTTGAMLFHQVDSDRNRAISFRDKHEMLLSHGAFNITWSPDGKRIACRLGFLGGRMVGTKIFGDDEVFEISPGGRFAFFDVAEIDQKEKWLQQAFRDKRR